MGDFNSIIYQGIIDACKKCFELDLDHNMVVVETPKDRSLGDYSCSIALRLAKQLHQKPQDIANTLKQELLQTLKSVESIEIAGPGFINFKMKSDVLAQVINTVLDMKEEYGKNDSGKGKNILVEWVSANPTGPLHCGHARNAAWGDSISRLLEASGYNNLREFYVNDAGNQIVMLRESLISRYFEQFGKSYPLPDDGYHGQDIIEIAKEIAQEDGDKWLTADEEERNQYFRDQGVEREIKQQIKDLALFRIHFDSWMHETFFYENDRKRINDCLARMKEMNLTYEKDGALWFKSSEYGDDKDRVLRKSDGTLAYLTPDIANHVYKLERGYQYLVNLWGADHHSYVTRMKCALKALGYPEGTLEVDIIQMVRMVEDGVEVKMSKRTGNAITIRELCEDVGVDAARWFFVSKDVATHMDFDLKLARSQDNNNPVYYAQYAYSRMYAILNNPDIPSFERKDSYDRLTDPKETQLLKMISEFPQEIASAAATRKPNKMTDYIINLVKVYHSYYNSCRVNNPDDLDLTNQRLGLVHACMITLKNALNLVGVNAPEKM